MNIKNNKNKMKRALVLSGGGSKGSWSSGVISYLSKEKGTEWDIVIGTSTGSLLSLLSSIGEVDRLKEEYTSVNNDTIFNKKPFNNKGKLRILNAIWRIITGKNSLGEARNLRKRLEKVVTLDDYKKARELGKNVLVTVSNMTNNQVEYKSELEEEYEDFCDWMLASASVPALFEVVNKNGSEYLDGGVLEPVPLQKAIDLGATEIDVIILSSNRKVSYPPMKNIIKVAMRTIDLMNKEITKDDILVGKLTGEETEVKINIYRTPIALTDNSIIFDKEEMTKWWGDGYDFAKSQSEVNIKLKRTKTDPKYKIKR
jgi:predicted patatin/cPLA2 family phospholipase